MIAHPDDRSVRGIAAFAPRSGGWRMLSAWLFRTGLIGAWPASPRFLMTWRMGPRLARLWLVVLALLARFTVTLHRRVGNDRRRIGQAHIHAANLCDRRRRRMRPVRPLVAPAAIAAFTPVAIPSASAPPEPLAAALAIAFLGRRESITFKRQNLDGHAGQFLDGRQTPLVFG